MSAVELGRRAAGKSLRDLPESIRAHFSRWHGALETEFLRKVEDAPPISRASILRSLKRLQAARLAALNCPGRHTSMAST